MTQKIYRISIDMSFYLKTDEISKVETILSKIKNEKVHGTGFKIKEVELSDDFLKELRSIKI